MAGENYNEAGDLRAIRTATEAMAAGGGGAASIADGADVAQGTKADAAWSGTGDGTLVAISKAEYAKLEAIRALLAGTVTISGAVTGPLTNVQLRDDPIEIVGTVLISGDPATQTTSAAILAKLIAAPATEGKQDTANTSLAAILAAVDGLEGSTDGIETALALLGTAANQATIIGHVDGIEGALASILAKIIVAPATEAKQDTGNTSLASILTSVDSVETLVTSTNTKLDTVNTNLGTIDGRVDGLEGVLGTTAGAAVVTDANGTVQQYLRGIIVKLIAQLPAALAANGGLKVEGVAGGVAQPVTGPLTNAQFLANSEYETVAASATAQALGATGAAGDYIAGVLVIPTTTSPGNVLLLDNATSITIFTGGASSVSNLVPFFIPLGMTSVSGAWKLTTGANVSCIGIGNFT